MTHNHQQPDRQHNLLADLPQQTNVGVYAGVATEQINQNHQHMQTDDGIAFAKQLGWTDEHIMLFNQDFIPSDRLDIDKREGLNALVGCIERDEIKAVIVSDEIRLFRDATGIHVNLFIRLCQEHTVFVITRQTIYDFSNPQLVKLFRSQCENG